MAITVSPTSKSSRRAKGGTGFSERTRRMARSVRVSSAMTSGVGGPCHPGGGRTRRPGDDVTAGDQVFRFADEDAVPGALEPSARSDWTTTTRHGSSAWLPRWECGECALHLNLKRDHTKQTNQDKASSSHPSVAWQPQQLLRPMAFRPRPTSLAFRD